MDIRGYFGEKKETTISPVVLTKDLQVKTSRNGEKSIIRKEDDLLIDSDSEDEKKTRNIKRLKKSGTLISSERKISTPEKKDEKMNDAIITITSAVKSPKTDEKVEVNVHHKSIAVPVFKNSALKPESEKKRKVTLNNASEFFGDVKIITTTSSSTPAKIDKGLQKLNSTMSSPNGVEKMNATPVSSVERPNKKVKQVIELDKDESTNESSPIQDKKFVVSGVFETMSREKMEDTILKYGGKVMSAISGKTNYLVIGSALEDGRAVTEGSKYRAALEKKIPRITEEQLLQMVKKCQGQQDSTSSTLHDNSSVTTKSTGSHVSLTLQGFDADLNLSSAHAVSDEGLLWVDKHKPKTSNDMIGSMEIIRKMRDWLQRWEAVHIQKTVKIPFNKENPGARAALLSGPPGIGKTTVATLVASELGYSILEMNASDTRNKKNITEQLTDAVMTKAISSNSYNFSKKKLTSSSSASSSQSTSTGGFQRRLVIMDEVDGMGGSDRGGVAELIKVIKMSKVPIICICNDRQSQKIRSLAGHCYDLRIKRPTKTQIANRLVAIAKLEGMILEQNAGEILVEQVGNDIRQAIHTMQMWKSSSNVMNFTDTKSSMHRIEKDKVLRQSPFDACSIILAGAGKTSSSGSDSHDLDDRYNSFFIDYSLVPLLIQQNYIDSAKSSLFRGSGISGESELKAIETLSAASDACSDMELAGASIRGLDQHWELLPTQAAFSLRVGSLVNGFQPFPQFPAWLGKYSSTGKKSRLTKEIVHHTSLSIGQGFNAIRQDYIPFIRQYLLQNLQQDNRSMDSDQNERILKVLAILDHYGLNKEDFMENMRELQFIVDANKSSDKAFQDKYAEIDSKIKSTLTRMYNSTSHRSQVLLSESIISARKTGKSVKGPMVMGEEDGDRDNMDGLMKDESDDEGTRKIKGNENDNQLEGDSEDEVDVDEIKKKFSAKKSSNARKPSVGSSSQSQSTKSTGSKPTLKRKK